MLWFQTSYGACSVNDAIYSLFLCFQRFEFEYDTNKCARVFFFYFVKLIQANWLVLAGTVSSKVLLSNKRQIMIRAAKAKETDREYLSWLKSFKWAQGVIPWGVGGGDSTKFFYTSFYKIEGTSLQVIIGSNPPPPGKYEKLPTCSFPPCRPLNIFIHSEVKRNLSNVSVLTLSYKILWCQC